MCVLSWCYIIVHRDIVSEDIDDHTEKLKGFTEAPLLSNLNILAADLNEIR